MSWIDQIKNDLIITTGDGREFRPGWINASRSMEFNVSQFEFPGKKGTLVDRREPKGIVYNMEIHFQGADHLDESEEFLESAKDKRFWKLSHPFYGSINVQPLALNFDNTTLNISKITGSLVETITDDNPKIVVNPVDKIISDKAVLDGVLALSFATNVRIPNTSDIIKLQENNTNLYNLGKKRVKLTIDAQEYFNAFNNANAAIIDATAEPLAAITTMQAVLNKPGQFTDSVQNRLVAIADQINILRLSVETSLDPTSKRIFENNTAILISSILLASVTPIDGDYKNRLDVLRLTQSVVDIYNQFLIDIDSLQTDNGGDTDSYLPDSDGMRGLNDLVNYTVANLFNIALDSKQERTVILEEDSNAIELTHRFYGLDINDENLDAFIENNNLGINQMLGIRKGTKIIYYV
jgi:hypothetical protein